MLCGNHLNNSQRKTKFKQFIIVIALSGVEFGLKSDFRPKLHDPKFNYHFIRYILKSHNLIAQIQELHDFGQYQYLLNQVAKFANKWLFCLSLFCDVIGYFKKALKSDWLFCFTVPFSLVEKKMRFRAKDSAIREKIASLRANHIARLTSDF